jgi:hypothetical protein
MATDKWLKPDTLTELGREVERSRTKYPGNEHMLAAIVESTGSLAGALLCSWGTEGIADNTVRDEALKVAAIALRLFEEGDVTFQKWMRRPAPPPLDVSVSPMVVPPLREVPGKRGHERGGDGNCG